MGASILFAMEEEIAMTGSVQELGSLFQSKVNKVIITHDCRYAHSVGKLDIARQESTLRDARTLNR